MYYPGYHQTQTYDAAQAAWTQARIAQAHGQVPLTPQHNISIGSTPRDPTRRAAAPRPAAARRARGGGREDRRTARRRTLRRVGHLTVG